MENAYNYSIRLLFHLLGKIGLKLDFLIPSIICKLCTQTWLFVFRFNYFLQESITGVANCSFPIIVCFLHASSEKTYWQSMYCTLLYYIRYLQSTWHFIVGKSDANVDLGVYWFLMLIRKRKNDWKINYSLFWYN